MTFPALLLMSPARQAEPAVAFATTVCSMRGRRNGASSSPKPPSTRTAASKSARRPAKRARRSPPRLSGRHTMSNTTKWERVQPDSTLSAAGRITEREFTRMSDLRPESCPALVLNADFSPLSYMPLSLWPWQEVVKAVFLERVTVVATYDIGVRSPGMIFPLPSVVSLKQYQPMAVKRPAFSRFNVFMRDQFSCQYCGLRFPTHELTFDHVVPRCRNGKTNWKNVVTACVACNHRKGRSMLHELRGMQLTKLPSEPSNKLLQNNAKKFPPQYLHESWRDYVYWSQSMEVEKESDK